MRLNAATPPKASSRWVIGAAFLLALVSITVVTTLQHRAN
jgi:hypothetical protein